MRIAVDASSAAVGGGITYLQAILPRLEECGVFIGPILLRASAVEALDGFFSSHREASIVLCKSRAEALGLSWRSIVRQSRCDLVFVPTDVSLVSYEVPTVLALRQACLDTSSVWEYGFMERSKWWLKWLLARGSVRHAHSYIAISREASRVGLDRLGISPDKIVTIYHGGPSGPPVRAPRVGPARNYLFVSNLYRYKNLHRLIPAFARLPADSTLSVAGAPLEASYYKEIAGLIDRLKLSSRVRLLGHQSRVELLRLYRSADCFVWPSYAETFGHPLLEAHHEGLPILAANVPVNREIAGDAADYFEPFDVGSIHRSLEAAWQGELEVASLPRSYNWAETAQLTAAHFRGLVASA